MKNLFGKKATLLGLLSTLVITTYANAQAGHVGVARVDKTFERPTLRNTSFHPDSDANIVCQILMNDVEVKAKNAHFVSQQFMGVAKTYLVKKDENIKLVSQKGTFLDSGYVYRTDLPKSDFMSGFVNYISSITCGSSTDQAGSQL